MNNYIDVIVPRVEKFSKKSSRISNVHVIGHLEGLCHIYLDNNASLDGKKDHYKC